jgi:aminopeptidase-like protein
VGDTQRIGFDAKESRRRMRATLDAAFPVMRSITGDGVRTTLELVRETLPITVHEVPTGTTVLDWTVPKEWNIRDAYVADSAGRRVVDLRASNLHLVSYSVPVHRKMSLAELQDHLFSLPDQPDLVPYRTAYYADTWGFCLTDHARMALHDDEYEVVVDTTLTDGHLTYGELFLPGTGGDAEILLTTHVCHPSMANDNCSGIAVLTELGRLLSEAPRRHAYRLLFIPATIGSITWLARNESNVDRIRHGVVLAGLGDPGELTYKRSRRGNADVDRAAAYVLAHLDADDRMLDFSPYGYDERQFCSPGFDLPVGRLTRTPHGEYPEYHTSADDRSFVDDDQLVGSLEALLAILEVLDGDGTYVNTRPKGEPQLGRRGLYRSIGGDVGTGSAEVALLWVLNQSDGRRSLLDIAGRAGLPFTAVRHAADLLEDHDLLVEVDEQP